MRRLVFLAGLGVLLVLVVGCAGTGQGVEIHDKEQESYQHHIENLRTYSMNMLAAMAQARLDAMSAAHAAQQKAILDSEDEDKAQKAVADEKLYQATLNVLQSQVTAEMEKIIGMERDSAAAEEFHKVVQASMKNADRVDFNQVLDVAEAFTKTLDLDLGPLSGFFDNLRAARGLPEVNVPALVPGK